MESEREENRCETAENPKSKFPKLPELNIGKQSFFVKKADEWNDEGKEYRVFGIQDIYSKLFAGVSFSNDSFARNKSYTDRFAFLLPDDVFGEINGKIIDDMIQKEESRRKNTAGITKKEKSQHVEMHCKEFFVKSGKMVKITKLILDMFSDDAKAFVEKMQKYFVQLLKHAVFSKGLLEYLEDLADNVIVPNTISPKAHKAFHALFEENSHEAVSKIIANIFLSAMLGLYPIEYRMNKSPYYRKTYLLDKLGMEYVWAPDEISGPSIRLRDIEDAYDGGDYFEAYENALVWLVNFEQSSNKHECAEVYMYLGVCLIRHFDFCDPSKLSADLRNSLSSVRFTFKHSYEENLKAGVDRAVTLRQADGVRCMEKSISLDENNSEANFVLFEFYKIKSNLPRALTYLKAAFGKNHAKAVAEAAAQFLSGNRPFEDIDEETILEKINYIIDNERENSPVDVGECLYLRGQFACNHGDNARADADFEAAANCGHERARLKMSRKKRIERHRLPVFSTADNAPCCFANSVTGKNLAVISSFPSNEWSLYAVGNVMCEGAGSVRDADEFIEAQYVGKPEFCRPRLVFLFMSEDEEKNLNECLSLLDKLFNMALELQENLKWELIDAIDIFVAAEYETASMLIDANISDMGKDIYFKVHIADESRDSVHRLICDAPLFIPALNGVKKENFTHVVLFGDSQTNYTFIKESVACAYLGDKHPISITLIGKNADRLAKRFRCECPGIYDDDSRISCIRPEFIACDMAEADFPTCIYGIDHGTKSDNAAKLDRMSEAALADALSDGNYFVVDYADDLENIRFAMDLRTWLLRSRGTFDRVPFIAVKCDNEQNSFLAAHLTLSGRSAGNLYYNQYDLFPFGVAGQIYSYNSLIENPVLRSFALRIHKSYYGDAKRAAENDFYSYSYNSDSSLSTAIGLTYRLFAAGAAFADRKKYLDYGLYVNDEAAAEYGKIVDEKAEERLAALEQSRWNGFMLSRGWESASAGQVLTYKEQSTGSSHKHFLAKLHPFIREWDDLEGVDLLEIMNMLKSKFDYGKSPKVTTMNGIKSTLSFFEIPLKDKEETR